VYINDETGVETKGNISYPQQTALLKISEEWTYAICICKALCSRDFSNFFNSLVETRVGKISLKKFVFRPWLSPVWRGRTMRPRDVLSPGYGNRTLGVTPVSVCYRRANRRFRDHLYLRHQGNERENVDGSRNVGCSPFNHLTRLVDRESSSVFSRRGSFWLCISESCV
jgi:hypothetical protein